MTRDQKTHNFKITNAEIFKVNILESIKNNFISSCKTRRTV